MRMPSVMGSAPLTKRRLAGAALAFGAILLAIGAVVLDRARQREDRGYAPRLAHPAFVAGEAAMLTAQVEKGRRYA